MSDPQDHSQSEFEEAQRFWGEYARRTSPGGQRAGNAEPSEGQNGHGTAAAQAHECLDWCPICRTADVVRATASPELREQLNSIQREALITVRTLLDHYLQRLDEQPRDPSAVEEIPIE